MRRTIFVTAIACFMAAASVASATTTVRGIAIDFVTIGNPGNPGDTEVMNDGTSGYGAVGYAFKIGKYEVTNAQWYDFVTAAGAPTGNPSYAYDQDTHFTGDNIPTTGVSWYEAAQFCNYLTSGDRSHGAYQFSGSNSNPGDFEGINRDSAVSTYGVVYVIPTEDEWYKAAYNTGSGYSTFANGTDTAPIAGDDTNYNSAVSQPWDVGSGTQEQNGTYDMMGNVWDWNETLIDDSARGLRGGSCAEPDVGPGYFLRSSRRTRAAPHQDGSYVGFRVASVPEPATLLLLGLGGLMLHRRRQA